MSTVPIHYHLNQDFTYAASLKVAEYSGHSRTSIVFGDNVYPLHQEETPKISSAEWMPIGTYSEPVVIKTEKPQTLASQMQIDEPATAQPADVRQSLAYRKIKRQPLLQTMFEELNKFATNLGQPESAMYYSKVKDLINEIWNYTGNDEHFSMLVSTVDSIMRFNLWRNIDVQQAKALVSVTALLLSNDIELKDVKIATISLQKTGLNLFPYEEHYEEEKKTT